MSYEETGEYKGQTGSNAESNENVIIRQRDRE